MFTSSPQVALTETVIHGNEMAWRQSSDWMSLPQYVADHSICELPCSLLSKMMSAMGIKGHSKLNHRLKAELFLKTLGKSDAEVDEILTDLKVRTRTTNRNEDEQEEENADQDKEQEILFEKFCVVSKD